MFTNMDAATRWGGTWGNHQNFVAVEWHPAANTWYAIDNNAGPTGLTVGFKPDAANGDFIVGEIISMEASAGIQAFHNWIFDPSEVDRDGTAGLVNGFQDTSNRLWFHDWTDPDLDRNKPYQFQPMGHMYDARVNTSYGWTGSESLQLTTSEFGACSSIYFSHLTWHHPEFWDYRARSTVTIPKGEKWVLSWRVKTDAPAIGTGYNSGRFGVWVFATDSSNAGTLTTGTTSLWFRPNITADSQQFTKMSGNTSWEKHWMVLDFRDHIDYQGYSAPTDLSDVTTIATPSSNPRGVSNLYLDNIDSLGFDIGFPGNSYVYGDDVGTKNESVVANTFWFDAFQLERVPDESASPSPFKDPSSAASLVFGREITDGKVVAHYSEHYPPGHGALAGQYGPIPYLTPTGLPNREPHGDLWINTSNNNQIFRY